MAASLVDIWKSACEEKSLRVEIICQDTTCEDWES
jgi:hypothetical protein